ncbi:MAG: crosslink repair DNA glycosylase YcaQ family protein [Undibacterium sp.]|uniref:winged helix-turn-helix domain-containing protein n=1 Tax=Undibacterium sp. TaxID=1914977 RepID=UPI00271D32FF|nr:crosslink repair DNA glycosylase YcaQ family protein [Undibacterium sp.]MDO8652674.1 crosslink repair DNA glycosylase YcaQ family protein [Undibacterium sp.]
MQLTLASARALHLAAQGLLTPLGHKASKKDVLHTIRQMAALQIDTINVVARSPYLVLWSRLGAYQNSWLDELLAEGEIFEYWSHEACFLPIEDYALYRHQMVSPQGLGWKYNHRWLSENAAQVEQIRQHIHQHGETRSSDFERKDGKAGGWWEWKPEKRSLEVLFTIGELMVARRLNFQRIYDLRERVHSRWNDQVDLPRQIDCQRQQVLLAVRALGCAKAEWVADYFRMKKLDPAIHPSILAQQGRLLTAQVDGWDQPIYIHPDHENLLRQAAEEQLKATCTKILSPFDPVVWDRKRALELFNFDYRLECYTPAPKRRHGYFSLPILRRGALIGRMDAKAHRKDGVFEIKALYLEPEVRVSQALADDIGKSIKSFAQWHQTPAIHMPHCESPVLAALLKKAF